MWVGGVDVVILSVGRGGTEAVGGVRGPVSKGQEVDDVKNVRLVAFNASYKKVWAFCFLGFLFAFSNRDEKEKKHRVFRCFFF